MFTKKAQAGTTAAKYRRRLPACEMFLECIRLINSAGFRQRFALSDLKVDARGVKPLVPESVILARKYGVQHYSNEGADSYTGEAEGNRAYSIVNSSGGREVDADRKTDDQGGNNDIPALLEVGMVLDHVAPIVAAGMTSITAANLGQNEKMTAKTAASRMTAGS